MRRAGSRRCSVRRLKRVHIPVLWSRSELDGSLAGRIGLCEFIWGGAHDHFVTIRDERSPLTLGTSSVDFASCRTGWGNARASSNARNSADGFGQAVASALSIWADRFRQGSNSLGDYSTIAGKDAARFGTAALGQLSKETEQRPLAAVATALGVGILIGMAIAGGRSR